MNEDECRVAFLSEGARRAGWPDLGSLEEGLVTSRRAGFDDRLCGCDDNMTSHMIVAYFENNKARYC